MHSSVRPFVCLQFKPGSYIQGSVSPAIWSVDDTKRLPTASYSSSKGSRARTKQSSNSESKYSSSPNSSSASSISLCLSISFNSFNQQSVFDFDKLSFLSKVELFLVFSKVRGRIFVQKQQPGHCTKHRLSAPRGISPQTNQQNKQRSKKTRTQNQITSKTYDKEVLNQSKNNQHKV